MLLGRLRGALLASLLLLALAAPSADAAVGQPIDLGAGQNPTVTVEPDGTADITFTGRGVESTRLFYCRLPRGATACAPITEITTQGDSLSKPLAFTSGGVTRVISYRYGLTGPSFSSVLMFTSTDGGNTFGGSQVIGSIAPYDFAFGPGDAVSGITSADQCGTCFQAWSLTGGSTGPAVLSSDHPYVGSVAMINPQTPIAVFANGSGAAQFRVYGGVGDVNDQASWSAPVDLGQLDYPHLVSGPSGVIMVAQNDLSGPVMEARRFDGTTFGARVKITDGTRADHAAQDGAGRMHVVGGRFTGTKTDSSIFYATSDDGTSWHTESVDYPGVPQNMRLAIAQDHFGVVVGTLASNNDVFVASVGPSAAEPSVDKFVETTKVSGTVLIQVPPSKKFVPLQTGDVIPVGSVVDATNGRVRVTIALPNGTLQSSDFYQGIFRVTQAKSGLATMVLAGGSFRACGASRSVVQAAKSKKVIRNLWGSGSGRFATKGRYAAAAIRGTTWDTIDRCDGTLIRVTQGRVAVTNLRTKKVVAVVRAGKSFFVGA